MDVVNTVFRDDEYFVGEAIFAYYPTDNLRLSAGVQNALDTTSVVFGAEAMVAEGKYAPSFFVDASIDEDKTTSVSAGIRLYFGGSQKSLIRRHREDDPKVRLQATSDAFGRCLSKTNSGIFTGEGCRRGTADNGAGGTELASSSSDNTTDPITTGSTNASGGGATTTSGTAGTTTTATSGTSGTTTSGGAMTTTAGNSDTTTSGNSQTATTGSSDTTTSGGTTTTTSDNSSTTASGNGQTTTTGSSGTTDSGGSETTSTGSTGTTSAGSGQTGTGTTTTTGTETTIQEPPGIPSIIPFVLDTSGSSSGNGAEGSTTASSSQTTTTSMDMSQTFPEPPGIPDVIPF